MCRKVTRRAFLNQAAGVGGLAAAGLALSNDRRQFLRAQAKNPEKIRIALMGVNDRGLQLARRFVEFPEVELAYVCDPDAETIPKVLQLMSERGRRDPVVLKDFRTALDDSSVHALVCAAPDHWHALATILACEAGKDVYVEKPACVAINDGLTMIAAARKYNRIVQAGTWQRSGAHFQQACELVRNGTLGKVAFVRTWIYNNQPQKGIGNPPDAGRITSCLCPAASRSRKPILSRK